MKKSLILLSTPIAILPIASVISCGSSTDVNSENLNIVKTIKDFQKENNDNLFSIPTNKFAFKSIINIENKTIDSFKNDINKYVSINAKFNELLTKNNNSILNKISLITFSPIVDSQDLNIFIFVGGNRSDKFVIKSTIKNYLDAPFAYEENKIIVIKPKENITNLLTKENFNNKFNQLVKKENQELISFAFEIDEPNLNKIKNNIDSFTFEKIDDSSFKIVINESATIQGFVLKVDKNYFNEIYSQSLVK